MKSDSNIMINGNDPTANWQQRIDKESIRLLNTHLRRSREKRHGADEERRAAKREHKKKYKKSAQKTKYESKYKSMLNPHNFAFVCL